ncbi:hypothetical protein EZS27_043304, partial [termite gut metagenome]
DNFTGIKITGVLEHFDELVFKQFLAALGKQKITLSLKQQDEWAEYFNEYQSVCSNFIRQIDASVDVCTIFINKIIPNNNVIEVYKMDKLGNIASQALISQNQKKKQAQVHRFVSQQS